MHPTDLPGASQSRFSLVGTLLGSQLAPKKPQPDNRS